MSAGTWNPDQYERFRDERSQPFFDLLALVAARPGMRAVDLGCGTGELTRTLHQRLGAAETLGLDSAPTMLQRAAPRAGDGLTFAPGDLAAFAPERPYDLVFSNAALQWLPDHPALLRRLTAAVAPDGGQLAFQVPANVDHPSHVTAAEVAAEEPFAAALGGHVRPLTILPPEDYARLLHGLGYRRQHVRLQVYTHLLADRAQVIEWVRGTFLTDYQRRLPPDLFATFLDRYRARLLPRLADEQPYLFPFNRILAWAQR